SGHGLLIEQELREGSLTQHTQEPVELGRKSALVVTEVWLIAKNLAIPIFLKDQPGREGMNRAQVRELLEVGFQTDRLPAPPAVFEIDLDELLKNAPAQGIGRWRQELIQVCCLRL